MLNRARSIYLQVRIRSWERRPVGAHDVPFVSWKSKMEALFVVVSAASQYPHITAVLLYDVSPKLRTSALNTFNAYPCKARSL